MNARRNRSYEDVFLAFSASVEKWLIRMLALAFALLVAFQALLHSPIGIYFSKVERMEGKPYQPDAIVTPDKLSQPPGRQR